MINKVILLGNVGQDPEIINIESGNKIAKFSLATSESYKNKQGERITITEWHNIVIYGKLADIVEMFVNKGSQLYIEGKIKTRSWDNKEGNKRYTTEIVLDGFSSVLKMVGKKNESDESSMSDTPPPPGEDDLPF